MTTFRGFPCCTCLAEWLPVYEKALLRAGVIKKSIDIYQLTGGAPESGGTHSKGGAFDIAQGSDLAISIARKMGADATWRRHTWQGFSIDHTHGVLSGCAHNSPARYQISAVDDGYNGLGANGRGGKDDGPRPLSKRTWVQGIAWAKAQEDRRYRVNLGRWPGELRVVVRTGPSNSKSPAKRADGSVKLLQGGALFVGSGKTALDEKGDRWHQGVNGGWVPSRRLKKIK